MLGDDLMSEIEHLRAEVEGLRRIIARSDAKADMWQIRAEAAEARLRKVEALADEFDLPQESGGGDFGPFYAEKLRAALAAEPAEVTPPTEHVCTPCWFENHKDCTGKAAKTAAIPCPCDCRPTLLFGRPPAEVTPPAEQRDDWCTCGHLREHHDGVNGCYRGDPGAGWDCTCMDFTPEAGAPRG